MDLTDKQVPPQRQPWRIILARLQIMHDVLTMFGYDQTRWDWRPVLIRLVLPSLNNANPDVRVIAIETIVLFYRQIGEEVRVLTKNTDDIKNNIRQVIIARMSEADKGLGAARNSSAFGVRSGSRESETSFVKGYELENETPGQ